MYLVCPGDEEEKEESEDSVRRTFLACHSSMLDQWRGAFPAKEEPHAPHTCVG